MGSTSMAFMSSWSWNPATKNRKSHKPAKEKDRQADRQADRQSYQEIDRQGFREKDRQTDGPVADSQIT